MKRISIKIGIKKYKNYWRVKLKRKITLTKEKKKNKDQICKNNIL
jgi:hypothetical protein